MRFNAPCHTCGLSQHAIQADASEQHTFQVYFLYWAMLMWGCLALHTVLGMTAAEEHGQPRTGVWRARMVAY